MKPMYKDIKTISEVHRYYNCDKPKHPLVTVIDLENAHPNPTPETVSYRTHFYTIMCKRFEGTLRYGRSLYDFEEGTLMFSSPEQIIHSEPGIKVQEGWGLFFHPDLLKGTPLAQKIPTYSFFQYLSNEALHVSEEEKAILWDIVTKIRTEYQQRIDKHTKGLIVENLQLLLSYCERYYERQFFTREPVHSDLIERFESLLIAYFSAENTAINGLPDVKYFASALHLSPNYLSDVLTKFTGKTTIEHIHLHLIDQAKNLLVGSEQSISEIAYALGFEYVSHFSKLFKSKTGISPKQYRMYSED